MLLLRRGRRRAGLNLLEMVFASTIFAMVGGALMGVWAMHARAVGHARGTLLATHLAEMKMEEYKSRGWQVRSGESTPWTVYRTHSVLNGQPIDEEYRWKVVVTRYDLPGGGQYKMIEVTVTWEEREITREVKLETIITWQT